MAQVIDPFGKQTVKKKKVVPVIPSVTNKPPVTKTMDITPPPVVTPPRDLSVRPFTRNDPGTFEEGVAFRAAEAAKNQGEKVVLKDEGLTGSAVGSAIPKTETVATTDTVADLKARSKAIQRQRLEESLRGLVGSAERSAGVETGRLTDEFRGAEGRLRTQDTMARAGAEKFLNIGNLGQSGQVGQSSTAQNVITQGAQSQQTAQEQELKAGVQQRLAEVKAQAAQDLANFDFDVEIQELESQIRTEEAEVEYQREKEILAESREYNEYIRNVEKANDIELLEIKSSIDNEKAILDAEIDEARANNDFSRDIEFAERQAAIDLQKEAVKAANDRALEGQRQAGRVSLEEQKQAGREALQTEKDEAGGVKDRFDDNVFEDGAKTLLDNFNQFTEESVKEAALTDYLFSQIVSGNLSTDEQVARLEARFNLAPGTIERKLDAIEAQEQQSQTPGVGGLGLN